MNWDDFRFLLALSKAGSLSRAADALAVDHTTVGRRVESAETSLGVKLFTRTSTGYVPTADAQRLLGPMQAVEAAVLSVERNASAQRQSLEGTVRVTSPETFGIAYLAPRLAVWGRQHPGLTVELMPSGEVMDLGRRQAEIAVRFFRSRQQNLVVRRAAEIGYGLYGSDEYLGRNPVRSRADLTAHPILAPSPGKNVPETQWLSRLAPDARPTFVSTVSLALASAARASAGLAILPCYLGDAEPQLRRVPMPDAPSEYVWLTVHRDLQNTRRVRALLDFLGHSLKNDAALLRGRRS